MIWPRRGDVWLADLDPTRGREQAGKRPVLVVSDDSFNRGPAELVIALPITSTLRGIPSHIVMSPPEGGLTQRSAALCEAVRSISRARLVRRWGRARLATMSQVDDALRILLAL